MEENTLCIWVFLLISMQIVIFDALNSRRFAWISDYLLVSDWFNYNQFLWKTLNRYTLQKYKIRNESSEQRKQLCNFKCPKIIHKNWKACKKKRKNFTRQTKVVNFLTKLFSRRVLYLFFEYFIPFCCSLTLTNNKVAKKEERKKIIAMN